MTGSKSRATTSPRILGTLAVSAAVALGVAACGGSSGSSTTTVTRSAASSAQTRATVTQTQSAAPATQAGTELPDYKPSTVVSKTAGSTILTSPDDVSKISAFYHDALAKGGWQTMSSSTGPDHASFTARRPGQGVSVSVYPRGSGAGISVTVHPQ
jgi:hypothetical protein